MEIPQDAPALTLVQKVQLKLAESRFLTFSVLLHVIVLVLAGGIVIVKNMEEATDFAAEGGSGLVNEEVANVPTPPQDEPIQQQVFTPTTPQVNAPNLDAIVSTAATPANFTLQAAIAPVVKAPAPTDMDKVMNKAMAAAAGTGLRGLPGAMGGRAGGTQRTAARMANKGTDKSEKAVMAGLRWLKTHQNADGSWSKDFNPSMTGLALLCFLGHGETPESPEFGPTVKKGVDFLINKAVQFQGRLSMENQFTQVGVYEHGIGAYALGEYYTMTKDDRVKDIFTQAIAHIVNGQAPDGGWQYAYAKGPDSDTSVAGWQIQALKAAHLTGLNLPGVDDALDKAMLNLKRVQSENGNFGYRKAGDRGEDPALAGVGVLCTYFWKGDRDKTVRDGIKYILDKSEKEFPVEYKGKKADLYAWYYHTQACLMFGGTAWTKWNRWFQDQIADNQSPDGSWPPTGAEKPHGPQNEPDKSGPFYRTTLCVLMLEVFYRYMPSNK